jgi:6-pyruvoyltetrahydropterin/6-carboxytetrahydropterin synthase
VTVQTAGDVRSATGSSAETAGVSTTLTSVTMSSTNPSSPVVGVTRKFWDLVSAAHQIPNHPGKCRFLHGHNYDVEVTFRAPVDKETGFVIDFAYIEDDVEAAIKQVADHKYLNEVYPDMLPTAENLALAWLTALRSINKGYVVIRVWETNDCYATATLQP